MNYVSVVMGKIKNIKIVKFKSADQKKVIKFYNKYFNLHDRKELVNASDLVDISTNYYGSGGIFYLLIDGTKVVGGIGLGMHHNLWMIRRFFISDKYQSRGFGKQMLNKVITFAVNNKFEDLYLGCMNCYKVANKLYSKFGFVKCENPTGSKADFTMKKNFLPDIILNQIRINKNKQLQQLILNPVENLPFCGDANNFYMENYYVSSKQRKDEYDKIIFGGREPYSDLNHNILKLWQKYLKTKFVNFSPLSGLNTHLVLFLSMKQILRRDNIKCLLLSEKGGGHYSTASILEQLEIEIIDTPLDEKNFMVDKNKTIQIINEKKPDIVFIDRSEGLEYEDFSYLKRVDCIKIFDASQYLADIICSNNYKHPFDMGFNIMISTTHKNYPGYQKAFVAFKDENLFEKFEEISKNLFSSINVRAFINSAMPILFFDELKKYQSRLAKLTKLLSECLTKNGIPVIKRGKRVVWQNHIWVKCDNAYNFFRKLEQCNLLVNYRLLPYNLGHGLRIGVQNIVRRGIDDNGIKKIADWFKEIYRTDDIRTLKQIEHDVAKFAKSL